MPDEHWQGGLLVKAGLLCSVLALPLVAQPPQASDPAALLATDAYERAEWATEWLHSDDPMRVAWGAWLAKQDHQSSLIPLLLNKVDKYEPNEESTSLEAYGKGERDRHDALLAVLDALIELRVDVPVEEASKLFPEFPAQSLILLIHSHEKDLTTAIEHQRMAFRHAVAVLNAPPQVLTAAEAATLKPKIEIVIEDDRSHPTVPLPSLLENDAVTHVSVEFSQPLH